MRIVICTSIEVEASKPHHDLQGEQGGQCRHEVSVGLPMQTLQNQIKS